MSGALRFRSIFLFLTAIVALTIAALLMLLVSTITVFQARRFCAEIIAKVGARFVLWVSGVCIQVHNEERITDEQTIYIINHVSLLDLFVTLELGLPRTRYFMTAECSRVPPLWLIAKLIGTFLAPSQEDPEARRRCFQRADAVLRRTGDSVLLSPEGSRIKGNQIGPFNRGAFHLATSLQVSITPLYFHIPAEMKVGWNVFVLPGTIHVHILPPVDTSNWTLENINVNRDEVRKELLKFEAHIKS